jgi:hypothetical protein
MIIFKLWQILILNISGTQLHVHVVVLKNIEAQYILDLYS